MNPLIYCIPLFQVIMLHLLLVVVTVAVLVVEAAVVLDAAELEAVEESNPHHPKSIFHLCCLCDK